MVNDAKCIIPPSVFLPFPNHSLRTRQVMSVRRLIEITRHRPTPYVDAVSTDEYPRGIRILAHGLRHAILEVLLIGSIFDNRHLQSVEVGKGSLHAPYTYAFDHLDFARRSKSASVASDSKRVVYFTSYDVHR